MLLEHMQPAAKRDTLWNFDIWACAMEEHAAAGQKLTYVINEGVSNICIGLILKGL